MNKFLDTLLQIVLVPAFLVYICMPRRVRRAFLP